MTTRLWLGKFKLANQSRRPIFGSGAANADRRQEALHVAGQVQYIREYGYVWGIVRPVVPLPHLQTKVLPNRA
jgi:hypothetical protein